MASDRLRALFPAPSGLICGIDTILAEIGNEVYPVRCSAVPAPAKIQSPIKLSEVNSQTLGFQMIRHLINLIEISSQGLQNDRRSTLFIDKPVVGEDRKSTRLKSSNVALSHAVF